MNRSPLGPSLPARRLLLGVTCLGALAGLLAPTLAAAQSWPSKPVTWVVPFPAGRGTDAFARPLTAVLSRQLGTQ